MKLSEEEVKLSEGRINRARGEARLRGLNVGGGKDRAVAEDFVGEGEIRFLQKYVVGLRLAVG